MDAFHYRRQRLCKCIQKDSHAHHIRIYYCVALWTCAHVLVVNVKCIGIIAFCVRFVIAEQTRTWTNTHIAYVQYKERHRFPREQDIWSCHDAHLLPIMMCVHVLWCVDMIVGGVCDWAIHRSVFAKGRHHDKLLCKAHISHRPTAVHICLKYLLDSIKKSTECVCFFLHVGGAGSWWGGDWGRRGICLWGIAWSFFSWWDKETP